MDFCKNYNLWRFVYLHPWKNHSLSYTGLTLTNSPLWEYILCACYYVWSVRLKQVLGRVARPSVFSYKPVICFAEQNKWLVSIWNTTLGFNGLRRYIRIRAFLFQNPQRARSDLKTQLHVRFPVTSG